MYLLYIEIFELRFESNQHSKAGHVIMVKWLINMGADTTALTKDNETPSDRQDGPAMI